MSDDSYSDSESYYSEDSIIHPVKKRKYDDMEMIDMIKDKPMTIILVNQEPPEGLLTETDDEEEAPTEAPKEKSRLEVLKDSILMSRYNKEIKSILIEKLSSGSGSDIDKAITYVKHVLKLPVGVKRKTSLKNGDLNSFLVSARHKLDAIVYGMENVKEEIIDFLINRIYNPSQSGNIIALKGPPGVGKTRVCRALSEILDTPMTQLSFGGMTDSSYLLGHSSTYIGAKPGRIVNILQNAKCMNPIIYLDECFPYIQQVVTEYGYEYIGDLYASFISGGPIPKVLAYNEEDNTYEFKEILHAWKRPQKDMIKLVFRSDTGHVFYITCTANHRFLTTYRGYVPAGILLENESIITNTHNLIKLLAIEKTEQICDAYDLEVEGYHNFVICCDRGIHNMVVHNCDKISDSPNSSEVSGVLVHLLDESQNKDFTDLYLDNIPIDLSEVLFVLSFNDETKIDPILLDRMKVIDIDPLELKSKVEIVKRHILPEFSYNRLIFTDDIINYIINFRTKNEPGMRSIKKNIKTIVNRVNSFLAIQDCDDKTKILDNFSYSNLILDKTDDGYIITKSVVDTILCKNKNLDESWMGMYI